jgi:hypothetical protein
MIDSTRLGFDATRLDSHDVSRNGSGIRPDPHRICTGFETAGPDPGGCPIPMPHPHNTALFVVFWCGVGVIDFSTFLLFWCGNFNSPTTQQTECISEVWLDCLAGESPISAD